MSSSYEAEVQRFKAELRTKLPVTRISKRKRLEAKKYVLDLDTLECPVCSEPFSPPVFQCDNGHTACSNCCQKMNTRGCPSCSLPIGRIRCLAIEKLIESVLVECEHGCTTALRFCERDEHEKSLCEYRPFQCPAFECIHIVPMCTIPEHMAKEHDIRSVEWCESTRSANFEMRHDQHMHMPVVLVKTKEAWLLVSLFTFRFLLSFTCESVWVSKEVVFKLTVKPIPQMHQTVYNMESALSPGDHVTLYVPRHDNFFNVTVSLIT